MKGDKSSGHSNNQKRGVCGKRGIVATMKVVVDVDFISPSSGAGATTMISAMCDDKRLILPQIVHLTQVTIAPSSIKHTTA